MSEYIPVKFCVRCEDPIFTHQPRYWRAVLVAGRQLVSYFCGPCCKIDMPHAYAELNR